MTKTLGTSNFLEMANDLYGGSYVLEQAEPMSQTMTTKQALARCISLTVMDLTGPTSSDEANLQRIASAFEYDSLMLQSIASGLHKRRKN